MSLFIIWVIISLWICSAVAENYSLTQRPLQPNLDPLSFHLFMLKSWAPSAFLLIYLTCLFDSGGGPIFGTFREAALPPSSRNEVRNENTVFFEVSSEICTASSSWPCCYKPAIDPSVCARALDAAAFAGVVERPWMCVGARLCMIDGDSLQIYWSQKMLT